MRDIIFRGKRVDNDKWVEGSMIAMDGDFPSGQVFIFPPHDSASSLPCSFLVGNNMVAVDPKTVGQYTGLTDKNGTKIFEGDIIKRDYSYWNDEEELKETSVIEYGEWNCSGCNVVFGWVANGDVDLQDVKDSIVIGNIHDNNPEWLNAEVEE